MERCKQCGNTSPGPLPIVAIMAFDPMDSQEGALGISKDIRFAAWPMCLLCHRQPTIKAHFTYRQGYAAALAMAGSSNLG